MAVAISLLDGHFFTPTTGGTTESSGTFTPANNSLLIATFQGTIFNAALLGTLTGPSGGGLTWTRLRTTVGAASGVAMVQDIWTAPVVTGASMSVTYDYTVSGGASWITDGNCAALIIEEVTGHDRTNSTSWLGGAFAELATTSPITGAHSAALNQATASTSALMCCAAFDGDYGDSNITTTAGYTATYTDQGGTQGWQRAKHQFEIGAVSTANWGSGTTNYGGSMYAFEIIAASGSPNLDVPVAPAALLPRSRGTARAAAMRWDTGALFPQVAVVAPLPPLVQVQPFQPPNPATTNISLNNRRAAAIAIGDAGIARQYARFLPFAPVQPFQPPNPITTNIALNNRRSAALVGSHNPGNQQIQITFRPFGWPIQPVQPPNPATTNISLNNRRFGALIGGVVNIEAVYSTVPPVLAAWWETLALPPPRPRWMRAAALEGGIEWGGEQFTVRWINAGWEVQSVQPPAATKRQRQSVTYEGDDGIELPFIPPIVTVNRWGTDQTPFAYRRPVRFEPSFAENLEAPLGRFQSFGWHVQPPQPPHPTPERRFGAMAPLSNIESVFVPPVAVPLLFWDTSYPQPPHQRRERAGAIMPLSNIEGVFTFVPPPVFTMWESVWPQPPRQRNRQASQPVNIDATFVPPPVPPTQWESNIPQPPHPRREKAAGLLPALGLIETPLTRFIPFWRMAPPHPEPHPRREKAGSIVPPLALTESQLRVFYPTFWHVLPPEPHPMPNRGAGLLPAGVLPIIKFRAVILNPNYIAVGRPRIMVSLGLPRQMIGAGLPRNRVVLGITNQVSQTNELLPPIDSTVEIETVTFDFGLILAAGVTITGISSLTCEVVSGTDPTPAARLVGGAAIVVSPNSGGANQAVAQLVGTMIGGVTYRLQCVATSSDGQTISLWNHLTCQTPN